MIAPSSSENAPPGRFDEFALPARRMVSARGSAPSPRFEAEIRSWSDAPAHRERGPVERRLRREVGAAGPERARARAPRRGEAAPRCVVTAMYITVGLKIGRERRTTPKVVVAAPARRRQLPAATIRGRGRGAGARLDGLAARSACRCPRCPAHERGPSRARASSPTEHLVPSPNGRQANQATSARDACRE